MCFESLDNKYLHTSALFPVIITVVLLILLSRTPTKKTTALFNLPD